MKSTFRTLLCVFILTFARGWSALAGEFLIQSVDRDGTMTGFDLDLLRLACAAAKVPIIGCGGSGQYNHLKDAFLQTDVSALACGSLFNFSDSNPGKGRSPFLHSSSALPLMSSLIVGAFLNGRTCSR